MATQPTTSKPAKAGSVVVAVGILMMVAGVAMLATVALVLPGVLLLVIGGVVTAVSYFGARTAAKEPRA